MIGNVLPGDCVGLIIGVPHWVKVVNLQENVDEHIKKVVLDECQDCRKVGDPHKFKAAAAATKSL